MPKPSHSTLTKSFSGTSVWSVIWLFLCVGALLLSGCIPKKTVKMAPPGPESNKDSPTDDLPQSKKPLVSSSVRGRSLRYVISNNSGRTFPSLRVIIIGLKCEGNQRLRQWTRLSARPLFDGGSQRFRWTMPVRCNHVHVKADAVELARHTLRLKITGFKPPYVKYKVSNISRGRTYSGLVIHIYGLYCRNSRGWLYQRMLDSRVLQPGDRVTRIVRMRSLCRKIRVKATPMSPRLRRKYLEYLRRYRRYRRYRRHNPPPHNRKMPPNQPPPNQPPPDRKRIPDEV